MAAKKGPAPAPLDPKVAKKFLDLLSTDNDFRRLFKKDAPAALAKAGYKVSAGSAEAGGCMQLKVADRIAPKADIVRDRAKLEAALGIPMLFIESSGFKAR
ncbi:MAG: NHLP-related RiPP peptide [Pseudomonadota bacterium]|nr:NHLP-related RiPP peptide [Pseudomonadota bacterium]